jgi:hypothetical protein
MQNNEQVSSVENANKTRSSVEAQHTDDARCSWFFTVDNPDQWGERCPRLGVRYDRWTDRWWCDNLDHDA